MLALLAMPTVSAPYTAAWRKHPTVKAVVPLAATAISASCSLMRWLRTSAAPGEVSVVGSLDWSETTPGWIGAWRTRWHGADHHWGISGVNYDAAFRDIVRGVVLLASGHGTPD